MQVHQQSEQLKEPLLQAEEPQYKASRLRWLILFACSGIFFSNGLIMIAFASVAIQISQAYALSSTVQVNLCSISFALFSPPTDFLAVYLLSNYRVDRVLRVASLIMFIGAMLRFASYSTQTFWPILIGTFMMATVNSIFLNSQIIITNTWFTDKERAIAMAVLNISLSLGQIASFALTGFMFSDINNEMSIEE